MGYTGIQWTDRSENPVGIEESTGNYCQKISPACENCYAEVMARRLAGISKKPFFPYKYLAEPPKMELRRHVIESWGKRKKSYKNFVCSMTDLFLHIIPEEWIFEILDAMVAAPLQTFQILTKRSLRMRLVVYKYCELRQLVALPANIWLMVTVEDQKFANERIPDLLKSRCQVRGISAEPLLGPLDLYNIKDGEDTLNALSGFRSRTEGKLVISSTGPGLDWVITGGESGNKKDIRPSHPAWFLLLRDQCLEKQKAFFFKQWGEWGIYDMGANNKGALAYGWAWQPKFVFPENYFPIFSDSGPTWMQRIGRNNTGNKLDSAYYLNFPKIKQ